MQIRRPRHPGATALVVAAALISGCGSDGDSVDLVTELGQPGPYAVGYRVEEIRYMSPAATQPRPLRLALWYPTETVATRGVNYLGAFPSGPVTQDAPPQALGPRPVLLFSHGHLGFAEVSGLMMEHFASHGWLVASPDHTNNTAAEVNVPRTTDIYFQRPLDISAVLDHLLALPAEHPLAGMASDTVIAAGHSFGGYTTLVLAGGRVDIDRLAAACEDGSETSAFCNEITPEKAEVFRQDLSEPRIQALMPMASGDVERFLPGTFAALERPLLQMTGDLDGGSRNAAADDPLWQALDHADDRRLNILEAGHNHFTLLCAAGLGATFDCDGPPIDPTEALRIINVFSLAFARLHGLGDTSAAAVLNGERVVAEQVELDQH